MFTLRFFLLSYSPTIIFKNILMLIVAGHTCLPARRSQIQIQMFLGVRVVHAVLTISPIEHHLAYKNMDQHYMPNMPQDVGNCHVLHVLYIDVILVHIYTKNIFF